MNTPDFPADEAERLLALQNTQLLDTPPEERFDRITRLAARMFNVQTCLVSLVDNDRQWFKSKVGLEAEQLDRDISFCGHAILGNDILVIPDAQLDPRFVDNPLVTAEPYIRFYAGAPLREPRGNTIGTLCLIDTNPRALDALQIQDLHDLAAMVEREIANIDQLEFQNKLASSINRMSSIITTIPDMVFVIDRYFRFLACNDHPDLLLPREKVLGRTINDVLPPEMADRLTDQVRRAFESNDVINVDYSLTSADNTFESRARKIDPREVLVIVRNTAEQTRIHAQLMRLSEVARQTNNGVIITDTDGLVVWTNEALKTISGHRLEDMIGKRPGAVLQGENTDPNTIRVMARALSRHESFNVEILNYSSEGKPFWARIACNPLRDELGQMKGYIAIQSDITRERHDADRIRRNEHLLKAVVDANSIGTWHLNLRTRELQINDKWATLLGYRRAELTPTTQDTWESLTHPDDLKHCINQLVKHTTGQLPAYEASVRMKHKNGSWVWINTRGRITSRAMDGKPEWLLGTHSDISAQVQAENSLNEQSKQMQAIVENMLDGVISFDSGGTILTFNQAAEDIFGYSCSEILGLNISLLMGLAHQDHRDDAVASFVAGGAGHFIGRTHELDAQHKSGTRFPVELGLAEVHQGDETRYIGLVRDITQRKASENEVRKLAFYDPLTSLPNRRLLMDRLQQVLANCARKDRFAALLFLDLDNFKDLNDSSGHRKGDDLLCQVAQRLTSCVRQSDTVSRLGGDEFVVVIEDLSNDELEAANQAESTAEKIVTLLNQSFDLDGLAYNGSASIGVTTFNNTDYSASDLLKQADMAMYKAKAAGRNGIRFFDPEMQIAVTQRASLEQDLHDAIRTNQFVLYYQKQIDHQGRAIGAEVLLRWQHPSKGTVSPAQFIPLAEESGLIVPIGKWALLTACKTLAVWAKDPQKANLTIAVNISVVQFRETNIVQTILDVLIETGAPPHKLKLEITESLLASNFQDVKTKMLELQHHGVSFSIDDFGTGYSSLLYLKQLPLNQLKIDQSFVRDIIHSPNDQAIAQAVITLAAALNLNVIAEGVETAEQRTLLEKLGCKAYQGYLYGKPCALENLVL